MRRPVHPFWWLAGPLLLAGCFSTGDGVDPPDERIYFPVGLTLDAEARHLVVLNSDFDLQFNAGTLQVLKLGDPESAHPSEGVRRFIPRSCNFGQAATGCPESESCLPSGFCAPVEGPFAGLPCAPLAEHTLRDQLIYPGICSTLDPVNPPEGESLIASAVEIGAFATDIVYRARPSTAPDGPPGRIFFPVRGDATLHWADLDAEGRVECGQANNDGACDDRHRAGEDGGRENSRDLSMDPEPFAIDVTPDGRAIVVTHQTADNVALFSHDWSSEGPELDFDLERLGDRPVGVAALPPAAAEQQLLGSREQPNYGFLVTFRAAQQVSLVRYVPESQAAPLRPYLASSGSVPVLAPSSGDDSRGIAVDDSRRKAAETACFEQFACEEDESAACRASLLECLDDAAAEGLDVYVAGRSPETLTIGRTSPAVDGRFSRELPMFFDSIALLPGASRVVVGDVIVGEDGSGPVYERRVFVVCFDSRRVIVYDPLRRNIELEIVTGRGPHALAVDSRHGLLFVGHFTDSYVGVVSLDQRFPRTYGTMVATIGTPTPPRASK